MADNIVWLAYETHAEQQAWPNYPTRYPAFHGPRARAAAETSRQSPEVVLSGVFDNDSMHRNPPCDVLAQNSCLLQRTHEAY